MNDSEIVKDAKWEIAWEIINETDTNMFLTGKAGTGKTTFLRFLKEHTNKRLVVLAPTGIAAINARAERQKNCISKMARNYTMMHMSNILNLSTL